MASGVAAHAAAWMAASLRVRPLRALPLPMARCSSCSARAIAAASHAAISPRSAASASRVASTSRAAGGGSTTRPRQRGSHACSASFSGDFQVSASNPAVAASALPRRQKSRRISPSSAWMSSINSGCTRACPVSNPNSASTRWQKPCRVPMNAVSIARHASRARRCNSSRAIPDSSARVTILRVSRCSPSSSVRATAGSASGSSASAITSRWRKRPDNSAAAARVKVATTISSILRPRSRIRRR